MRQLTLILFLILTYSSYSQFRKGDTLYVWADSGLNFRETPTYNEEILDTISFGELIIFESYESGNEMLTEIFAPKYVDEVVKKSKSLSIKGNLVKVKYKDSYGYVYSGYLSKLPPNWAKLDFFQLLNFLKSEYGVLKEELGGYLEGNRHSEIDLIFNNNVFYKRYPESENCSSISFMFPDLTFKEGLLLVYMINNSIDKKLPDTGFQVINKSESYSEFMRVQEEVIYSNLKIREIGELLIFTVFYTSP